MFYNLIDIRIIKTVARNIKYRERLIFMERPILPKDIASSKPLDKEGVSRDLQRRRDCTKYFSKY